jgi:hypothetical protein
VRFLGFAGRLPAGVLFRRASRRWPTVDPFLASPAGHRLVGRVRLAIPAVCALVALGWLAALLSGGQPNVWALRAELACWLVTSLLACLSGFSLLAPETRIGPAGSLRLTPFPRRIIVHGRYRALLGTMTLAGAMLPVYVFTPDFAADTPWGMGAVLGGLARLPAALAGGIAVDSRLVNPAIGLLQLSSDLAWYAFFGALGFFAAAGTRSAVKTAAWALAGGICGLVPLTVLDGLLVLVSTANHRGWRGEPWTLTAFLSYFTVATTLSVGARLLAARMLLAGAVGALEAADRHPPR